MTKYQQPTRFISFGLPREITHWLYRRVHLNFYENMYSCMHCNIINVLELNKHLAPPKQLSTTAKVSSGVQQRAAQ